MAHRAVVHDLMKQFLLSAADLFTPAMHHTIARTFHQISDSINEAESSNNQKDIKYWSGMEGHAKNLAVFAQKIFSLTPSFLDILANEDGESILQSWTGALSRAEMQNVHGVYQIHKDISYHPHLLSDIPPDDLSVLYKNIRSIEVS